MAVLVADVKYLGPPPSGGLWLTGGAISQLHLVVGVLHSIVIPGGQLLECEGGRGGGGSALCESKST